MTMQCTTIYDSPIGQLTIEGEDNQLVGIWYEHQLTEATQETTTTINMPVLDDTKRWLDLYFAYKIPTFTPSICFKGTAFRQQVWGELLKIGYGETTTYGRIAKEIATQNHIARMSAQAVGGAVGHNPISIIVPCHRVIGADGTLTGYAGGIERKQILLEIERKTYNLTL